MNLTGYGYLLTLAQLSVGFAAISTIVIALRSVLGAKLSSLQLHFMRGNIERALGIMASCLLPSLLALFDLRDSEVWALASVLATAFWAVYHTVFVVRQYRIAGSFAHPMLTYTHYTIAALLFLLNLFNASGIFFEPYAAPYAVLFTVGLCQCVHIFLYTLDDFLESPARA